MKLNIQLKLCNVMIKTTKGIALLKGIWQRCTHNDDLMREVKLAAQGSSI